MALPPLQPVVIKGDGSTAPPIESGTVLLIVQNGKMFAAGRWVPTDCGCEITPPLNETEIIAVASERLKSEAPHLLHSTGALQLLCWPDLVLQMRFADQ